MRDLLCGADRHSRGACQHGVAMQACRRMTIATPASKPAELFGQPRGLWVLAGTELWARISFNGMQALLVLYMAEALLLPGHVEHIVGFAGYRAMVEGLTGPLSVEALAAQTFGLYDGVVD